MQIGTIAAGVGTVTTIPLTWLPEYLLWNNAVSLVGLRIIVQGDGVIVDLDTAGINGLKALGMIGRVANDFLLKVSDGIIAGKNVQIIATNGVAAAIPLWGFSLHNRGQAYLQSIQQITLAASGAIFDNFVYLSLANAVTATDIINVEFVDGLVQQFDAVELNSYNGFYQNDLTAAVIGFNNANKRIKKVQFTPAIAQNVYAVRWAGVGNVSQNVSMGG